MWTLANRDTLVAAGNWLAGEAGRWAWVGLRSAALNLIEQPWFAGFRSVVETPAWALGATALSLMYVSGILALRRLRRPLPGGCPMRTGSRLLLALGLLSVFPPSAHASSSCMLRRVSGVFETVRDFGAQQIGPASQKLKPQAVQPAPAGGRPSTSAI